MNVSKTTAAPETAIESNASYRTNASAEVTESDEASTEKNGVTENIAAKDAAPAPNAADKNIAQNFARWASCADERYQEELARFETDETARKDAFFQDLEFGTAGLRGVLGAGPNRMNIHTVGKATQGLANYLNKHFENPTVAIARDSRNGGEEFCQVAAGVLAANGIQAHLYERIEPTPALSWAVRDLHCSAGICITASHNPAEYNGYKAYGPDGCQITTEAARDIQAAINGVDIFDDVRCMPFDEALNCEKAHWIGEDTLDRFIDAVATQSRETPDALADLSVVYTPLNGTGLECVSRIFERIGMKNITVVPEQAQPDGNFPTCPYPNPEIRQALERGLALCNDVHPDLLVATDPDADRTGIAVAHEGSYVLLSGNEVGALLMDYLCTKAEEHGEDLRTKVCVSTIVSSVMCDVMAQERGFEMRRTLTGFKYIGEQIGLLEAAGQAQRFLFGFEESYGYLAGTHVRDKDAIVTSMLIVQMAAWHKAHGRTLVAAMEDLYRRYGWWKNSTISVSFPGAAGADTMKRLMEDLRTQPPQEIAGLDVRAIVDFSHAVDMPISGGSGNDPAQKLPAANVIEYQLEGGHKLIVRPSGTEPKVKAYAFVKGASEKEAEALLAQLEEAARQLLS